MLKNRLSMLRRESGTAPRSPEPTPPSDQLPGSRRPLSDRLRQHGRKPTETRRKRVDDAELAERFGATIIRPGLLSVDRSLTLEHHHGEHALSALQHPLGHLPLPDDIDPQRLLFFDTETTGLSGGVGTLAFMVGMARLDGDGLRVRQLLLTSLGAEAAMLELANDWAAGADACVSYNGLSFDLPLLAGRCRLSDTQDHFSASTHIDLLHPVRRAFARRWGQCRLADVEHRLLRFRRHDDLPGSEAPAAWLALLQRGDASQLAGVLRHNHWDLLSLVALLPALDQVYRDPARHHADLGTIARHWQQQGQPQRARQLLQQHRDQLEPREQLQLAWLYRQYGQWPQAVALWQPLAASGELTAIEALAKYHEHQCHDYQQALSHALCLPPSSQRERRCNRLTEQLQRQGRSVPGRSAGNATPQQTLSLRYPSATIKEST